MGYISTGMGDRFSALLMFLMSLRLELVDLKPLLAFFKLGPSEIHNKENIDCHVVYIRLIDRVL